MKTKLMASTMVAAVLGIAAVISVGAIAAPAPSITVSVPERADDFQLADHTRLAHRLQYFRDAPAIVLMSAVNGSPLSRQAGAELEKLQAAYKAKGVLFYMLNSKDSRDAAAGEAKAQGFDIPILMDENQLVGESLGVQREAEIFVVDPKNGFKISYHGPLNEGLGKGGASSGEAYAANAIDAVVGGKAVAKARIDVKAGAAIAFPARAKQAEFKNISYTKDVAPIIQAKCVTCHEKGGIAPFAMDSYEVVKAAGPMMRETIRTGRMPPYFADPHIGKFKNDQGMTQDQAKTLVHWLEAGAPRGTGEDILKTQAKVAPEWPEALGKPDVVIDLPTFDVPAMGVVPYKNQRVPNPFASDTWLRAIAIKPGNLSVLHHVISNHVPDPKLPRAKIPGGSVGSYTPGAQPQIIADGAGAPVPGGGSLNFQMHYTTTGKAASDHTQVGFYTLKAPPTYIKRSTVIFDFGMIIPAGEARHKEVAYITVPADMYLYTLYPHSHYRGYHVELLQKDADGKETMLLSLPKYDFNWQRDYDPETPILVHKGTKLIATWVFDNSPNNRTLTKETKDAVGAPLASYTTNVHTGEQSWDEMMYFRINYRWADETVTNLRTDLEKQLQSSASFGMADDNYDGLLQKSELTGMMASVLPRFDALDTDHSGALDPAELAKGGVGSFMPREAAPDL